MPHDMPKHLPKDRKRPTKQPGRARSDVDTIVDSPRDRHGGAQTPVSDAIDRLLSTLYANDVSGYGLVGHDVLRKEAVRRANEKLSSLDAGLRRPLKEGFEYRITEFDKFHSLSEEERQKVIEIAKQRAIPIERAYALRAAR